VRPETKYPRSGDVSIAYQTLGTGPVDLVPVPGWVSNVEYQWEQPDFAHFLERLASFSRLSVFDKRGTGLSDRVRGVPNSKALTATGVSTQRNETVRRHSDNGVGIVL
jgi:hypothetical protein